MVPIMGFITPTVAVILLVLALIIFGPGKLPDIGKALGRGISEFRSATDGKDKADTQALDMIKPIKENAVEKTQ